MIPILYEADEQGFTSNGLGRLRDCISLTVYEEMNGRYDAEFTYPVNGARFDEITEGRIIACTHDDNMDLQPFVIMSSSKPIDGIVTFNACHLSYRLSDYAPGLAGAPFANLTAQQILDKIANGISTSRDPFTLTTDFTGTTASWGDEIPRSCREWLGGTEGSVLDKFSGEYKFDGWTVSLLKNRGVATDVSIRYGKNLTEFTANTDYSEAYTDLRPFYNGEYASGLQGVIMYPYVSSGYTLPGGRKVLRVMDFSDQIDGKGKQTVVIQSELNTLAQSYLAKNRPWEPKITMDVDFVPLWQTNEYAQYAPLMKCHLCDTVKVNVGMYGINEIAIKIVAVEWDALRDRYNKMTLGGLATTLETAITSNVTGAIQAQADAIATLNSKTDIEVLTLTRTNNSYVDATSFARMVAIRCGKIGILFANLQMTSSMATNTGETEIGEITGVTLANSSLVTVPCQNNNATIMVDITTAGKINVANYSGTATGTNFFRSIIPLRFA